MNESDEQGTPFGRYELVRLLASGGMGELWLGRLRGAAGWEKAVAIKKILPHLHDSDEFLDRFIDEAKIAGDLTHGNIVPVFDMGVVDGEHFIAMEYVDGWDLRRILRRLKATGQRMPDAYALFVAAEVCKGLAHAHRRLGGSGDHLGIVHRDISPANVMVSRAGEVKITDFGIASARTRLTRTLTGQLKGKLAYMSPEQAAGQPVDARSDLFALGAVLYEMLTGARAFDGDGDLEVLARVQRGECTPIRSLRPELDADIVAIVERALAVSCDDRYPDADAMQLDVMRALFRDTGPITNRSFGEFVTDRMRDDSADGSGGAPGLDALLLAQLESAAGARTPSISSLPRKSQQSAGSTGTIAVPDVTPRARRRKAQRRSAIALAAVAVLVTVVAVLLPPVPASLELTSAPDGATVYIDGVEVGMTALRTPLKSGTHTVRVALDGYQPWQQDVHVSRSQAMELDAVLSPAPARVVFDSTPPGATVTVDGGAPFVAGSDERVPVGRPFVLTMELDGYASVTENVVVDVGQTRVTRRMERAPAPAVTSPPASEIVSDPGSDAAGARADHQSRSEADDTSTMARYQLAGIPQGARVTVDGEPVDPDRIELRVGRSPSVVAVDTLDGRHWETSIVPSERTAGVIAVELPAIESGRLTLHFPTEPYVGEIAVDGVALGPWDGEVMELPAGSHRIEVTNAAFGTRATADVDVVAGERTVYTVTWAR